MAKNHPKPGSRGPEPPRPAQNRRLDFTIGILLFLITLAVYSQVRSYEFIGLDDPDYVTENPHVRAGLTSEGFVWAFTTNRDGNWFPLTWLSHMLDWQLFGQQSGLHHVSNVLIHALSTLLLFSLLKRMTGSRWRSAFVAFLFALHPLHVESVAWVAERKDVLCAFFWFLTLWGYLLYVERPRAGRYLLVLVPFCFGLMAKPMIVTLPFVLLLLDVWPLRRLQMERPATSGKSKQKAWPGDRMKPLAGILWEKAPLFALSAVSAAVTYAVQQGGGAVTSLGWVPLSARLGNALISYVAYLAQMLWPTRLAVFYPHPWNLPGWQVATAGLAVLSISILVLRLVQSSPYLAVGWFWYLGTLVPVIGLVQVGMQARADRYTYIPLVGIFLMLAWGVTDVFGQWRQAKSVLAALSLVACSACLAFTWVQIQNWRNSETLFGHAIEVTAGNYLGYYGLGGALRDQGRLDEAVSCYREAIRIFPGFDIAYGGLGDVCLRQNRIEEAIGHLSEAIRLNPGTPEEHIDLGIALDKSGKGGEAISQMLEAIKISPDSANAHYNLGRVYANAGRIPEATAQFHIAIRLQPDNAEAHYNLGVTLASQGNMNDAVAEFGTAIQLKPNYAGAHNNLGSALANLGRIDEAIAQFAEALRLMPDSEEARRNLEYARSLKK